MPAVSTFALLFVCAVAVWLDVRTRRLPNWLTVGTLVVALALRATVGLDAVGAGLASAGLALVLGIPFFLVGGLGGGDVKLMAGLAAFLDPSALGPALLVMGLSGGLIAAFAAVRRRALRRVLMNIYVYVLSLRRRIFSREKADGRLRMAGQGTPDAITNPYGVAIALGALAGWFL